MRSIPIPGAAPDNEGPALSPLNPGSMHRAEDDPLAGATSPEFNERQTTDDAHTAPAATKYRSDPMSDTEQLSLSAMPSLTADDVEKSVTFYEGLGFVVDERWEEEGTLQGVMLRWGHQRLGLSQDDWQKGRSRTKGVGVRLYFETTQNVDDIAQRATTAGIRLDRAPYDTEWKSRAFEVTDPSGFLITITTPALS